VAVFGEQLNDTNSPPAIVTWTQVSAEGDRQLERIVKADKDPAEAMEDLQEEADSIGTEG
jgi:multiple sugar transport system substrate-binding protein